MYIRGILVFLAGFLLMILMAADFDMRYVALYVDAPSLFGIIIVIVAVITSQGAFKTFIAAINAMLSKKYYISAADKEKAIRLFKLMAKSVLYASIIICLISFISISARLEDPSVLGKNIAVSLLTIFYGLIINIAFIHPAINILETRYNTEEKPVISEKQVIDKLLELCYRQGISPEDVMSANEIQIKKQ